CQRHRLASVNELARALTKDAGLRGVLADYLTINVSEFYRDPGRFDALRRDVLPALLESRPSLKIWSAGCSIGAEAYTLAMILAEMDPAQTHSILATDIDPNVLETARRGAYP